MTPCERFTEAILESVGAGLPAPEVQAHLDGCAACRRLAAQADRALALVDALPPAVVPAGFVARVLARARAERRGGRAAWLAAAAAALLVVTGGLLAWRWRKGGPAATEVARPLPAEPPAELLEDWELIENLDLLQRLDVLEALDAVEAREQFAALDG